MKVDEKEKVVNLVGVLSPYLGWNKPDDTPKLVLTVPGGGEFLLKNSPISTALQELVYERVMISGSLKNYNGHYLVTVEDYMIVGDDEDDFWDDDDRL